MGFPGLKRLHNRAAGSDGRPTLKTMKDSAADLKTIPTLPNAALEAMAALKNPDCSLATLADIIRKDPALTTGILRLANSALYRGGRSIESIEQAVLRMGTRECQNLILTVSMHSMFRRAGQAQRAACEQLWRHSLLTASLCRRLNQALSLGFSGEEYACGVGHDLGRILIIMLAFESFQLADPLDFDEGPDILKREQAILGTDHCYFGAWYASMNQLPTSMISAIQFHHSPSEAGDHQHLIGLVATADHVANFLQRNLPIAEYSAAANTGLPFLANRLTEKQSQWLHENVHGLMDTVAQEVGEVVAPAA